MWKIQEFAILALGAAGIAALFVVAHLGWLTIPQ